MTKGSSEATIYEDSDTFFAVINGRLLQQSFNTQREAISAARSELGQSMSGYTSDDSTESNSRGEEGIAVEVMMHESAGENTALKPKTEAPQKKQPQGNPHEYLNPDTQTDGVPFDEPNSEHLSSTNERLLSILREYGLDPLDAGEDVDGMFATFHSQDDANKCRDVFKKAGYGASSIEYSPDRGYRAQTRGKRDGTGNLKVGDGFDPGGASLSGKAKLKDYTLVDGEPGQSPDDDIIHDEKKRGDYVMHSDANEQEPGAEKGLLVGVVEHEGHSAALHTHEDGGFMVRGRGSARYIQSESITDKGHAEQYAKEMLKAHAKMSEREVVSKNSVAMGAEGDEKLAWAGVDPKEKKQMWASLTAGSTHKITACMNKVEGHVDDPGAYCKSLADEVGYKPQ